MHHYPFIFSDERKYRLQRHLMFWLCWWMFQSVLYSYMPAFIKMPYLFRLVRSAIDAAMYLIPHMFLAYALMYFVVPKLLLKTRYAATVLSVLLLFVVTAAISAVIGVYVLDTVRNFILNEVTPASNKASVITLLRHPTEVDFFLALLAGLRGAITIGGLAAAIKLMKYLYVKEQRNLQLQQQNVEAQLQLLKAQVHPHFLFNTMNNIYSYTQDAAPRAAMMVAGLSDMLRYMLYEGAQPLVPLHKELKMLQDYIMLEQVRYDNNLDVNLDLPQHTGNLQIAPLLLLPLVENCFKHGASHMLEQPWISLRVGLEGNTMHLKLVNGKAQDYEPSKAAAGIGICNVQKRLDLLYPQKHFLKITDAEDVFVVNLKIELENRITTVEPLQPAKHATHA